MTDSVSDSSVEGDVANKSNTTKTLSKLDLLKGLQLEANALIAERHKSHIIHAAKNIRASGDVVESSVRRLLARRLSPRHRVGQGHVINPMLSTSPQFDIVIADDCSPLLFSDGNGTSWFPYESVQAIGEVKSSFEKYKKQIEAFCGNIDRTKSQFNWQKQPRQGLASTKNGQTVKTVLIHPLFTFMVFVDSATFDISDIDSFYKKTPAQNLPNMVYFVDKGILLSIRAIAC